MKTSVWLEFVYSERIELGVWTGLFYSLSRRYPHWPSLSRGYRSATVSLEVGLYTAGGEAWKSIFDGAKSDAMVNMPNIVTILINGTTSTASELKNKVT